MILALIAAALMAEASTTAQASAPEGVFQARGYSWLIDRTPDRFALYHRTGSLCWPDPDAAEMESIFARRVDETPDGVVGLAEETDDDLATVYAFDPLTDLPEACLHPDLGDRAAVIAIADLMRDHYPAFAARGVDFEARRSAIMGALPVAPTSGQAFAAAEALLAGLDDAHLELTAEIDGQDRSLSVTEGQTLDAIAARGGERPEREWLRSWRDGVGQTILEGQGHVAGENRLFWGVTDGVGYLAIVTMGGFDPDDDADLVALDKALDEAMSAFAGARAVIVDVSNNRGGYDSVSRHIAGRFADRPRIAYSKRGWASGVAAQVVEVRPSHRGRYLGPVWLLTSDITVSAGETFSQMMRVLPNVTQAGTVTRGSFSDQTPVPLANGWSFAMPMELYSDPQGRALEGRGLEPDVRIDLYPATDRDHGHGRAVRALMRRLSRSRVGG